MVKALPILLEEILKQSRQVHKSDPLVWKRGQIIDADLKQFEREAAAKEFDTLGLKASVWDAYLAGKAVAVVEECPWARVVALLPKGRSVPTTDWGRVFQMFGAPKGKAHSHWNIYWFGASALREFPEHGSVGAEHLNGGYTNICSTDGIFIYRLEEATRVLIHELMHAACLDPVHHNIPMREATVETWAELILVALRAKGSAAAAQPLWIKQCQWVSDTNYRAYMKHAIKSEADYGWRYLNGRAIVYKSLGLELPPPSSLPVQSRFTHPVLGD